MDVEKLEKILQEATGEEDVKPLLKTVAHWTKRIKAGSKRFTTENMRDAGSLKKISSLGIIRLEISNNGFDEEVTASLTAEGEELSADFFKKGFYL